MAKRMRQRIEQEFGGIFPQLEDGECEHAACEFIRMQRRLYETKHYNLMLPAIKHVFDTLGE